MRSYPFLNILATHPCSPVLSEHVLPYFMAVTIVGICTALDFLLFPHVDHSNLIMLYLLGVVLMATLEGEKRLPSILAALLSALAFDYFFIPPYFSFAVSDIQYFFTLMVMVVVSQIISYLTTHIRRQTEATRKAEMQAETERFRNTLLTSISHDLRTPLAAIIGSASSLLESREKLNETTQHELIQTIYDESERLNHLVHNVLQIIKIEARSIQLSKQRQSLEEVIGSALDMLEKLRQDKPLTIDLPHPMPLIHMDHVLIQQVLVNIIENAIKLSAPHSPLEIVAEIKGKKIIVGIGDRGPGLQPEELTKIFNKFYQGQQKKGLGLGLAICKDIIHLHGGEIWAENRPQGGAFFRFTLPIEES